MIRVSAISDIHGKWRTLLEDVKSEDVADSELLVLAGDLCSGFNKVNQEKELREYLPEFIKKFPNVQETLIIPGNHDYWLESCSKNYNFDKEFLGYNTKILLNEEYTFTSNKGNGSLSIFCIPGSDSFLEAFYHSFDYSDVKLPKDNKIDLLITHEAPRIEGLPCIDELHYTYGEKLPGNKFLGNYVRYKLKPKAHVFGHIHYKCKKKIDDTLYINVSSSKMFKEFIPEVTKFEV